MTVVYHKKKIFYFDGDCTKCKKKVERKFLQRADHIKIASVIVFCQKWLLTCQKGMSYKGLIWNRILGYQSEERILWGEYARTKLRSLVIINSVNMFKMFSCYLLFLLFLYFLSLVVLFFLILGGNNLKNNTEIRFLHGEQ